MIDIEEYKKKLEKFENYLDFAIDVTNATGGQKQVPWKLVRGNQLFIRMTITCSSIVRSLPFNRIFSTDMELWDLHSVLSLARNLIENYLMFWYISVEKIDEAESKFRLQILTHHLNSEKYKFYKEMGAGQEVLDEFEKKLPESQSQIKSNYLFGSLIPDNNLKKQIVNGTTPKYLTNNQIIERLPYQSEEFKPLYRFYSNHTHSTPFAIFSMNANRGMGARNRIEVDYISMALDFVTKYLLIATIETIRLFPFCESSLDPQKLKVIRSEFDIYSQNK